MRPFTRKQNDNVAPKIAKVFHACIKCLALVEIFSFAHKNPEYRSTTRLFNYKNVIDECE